jgi:hypothetical protein
MSSEFVPRLILHKFLVSGHSVLACDQDFGLIEKEKRYHKDIFVPDDWLKVIISAKKRIPFITKKMRKEDFFSFKQLLDNTTNRKVNSGNNKVEFRMADNSMVAVPGFRTIQNLL